jgi:hypothetical protein
MNSRPLKKSLEKPISMAGKAIKVAAITNKPQQSEFLFIKISLEAI